MNAFRHRTVSDKLTPSDFVELNRTGKPDVGCKPNLERTIESLRTRIRNTNKEMSLLGKALRYEKTIDLDKINRYQKLNESLKGLKIFEAEIVYLKNML